VIHLKRRETPAVQVSDEDFFFEVTRASFAQRRKTILKIFVSIKKFCPRLFLKENPYLSRISLVFIGVAISLFINFHSIYIINCPFKFISSL